MKHWKAGWARLNADDPPDIAGPTVPLVLCLPGVKDFPGEAVDDAKAVDCPACVKVLKQCKLV